MGLLDSVKSGLSNIGSKVSSAVEAAETKVADAVQSTEQKVVDFARSEFAPPKDYSKLGLNDRAGKSDFAHPLQMEDAVKNNAARNKQWTMADIKNDKDGFLKNVVQLDGVRSTKADYTACGTTSMLMGMIAGRPESLPELATKLTDAQGNINANGQALLGPAANDPKLKAALADIKNGKFSAAEVTQLADGLLAGVPQTRNPDGTMTEGTDGAQLISLRASIAKLGVSVPQMELQQFGDADGNLGHWRVGINGKQYNPWPDAKGQSSTYTGAQSLIDGSSDGKNWVCREKIYIDDNSAARNVYSMTTKGALGPNGQSWAVTSDPPLFMINYQKQADGTFKRTGQNADKMRQFYPVSDTNDIPKLFPDVKPRI